MRCCYMYNGFIWINDLKLCEMSLINHLVIALNGLQWKFIWNIGDESLEKNKLLELLLFEKGTLFVFLQKKDKTRKKEQVMSFYRIKFTFKLWLNNIKAEPFPPDTWPTLKMKTKILVHWIKGTLLVFQLSKGIIMLP